MLGKSGMWWFTTLTGALNATGAALLGLIATDQVAMGMEFIIGVTALVAFTGYVLGQTHSGSQKPVVPPK